ncbi:MAG: flagellar biosynthetic protein FliO [Stagnimonas sp.]|nr:flagellar biosynthetic protein FliO [Stagnimonas sp.]
MTSNATIPEALSPMEAIPLPERVELLEPNWAELPSAQALVSAAPVAATTTTGTMQLAGKPLGTSLAPAASPWTVFGSLLLVVGLILLLARGLRGLQGARKGGAQALQLRGSLQVGSRERVVWMQAGETHLLLGVAAGRVNNLHVFEVPPDFDQIDHKIPSSSDFAARLKQVLDRARQRAASKPVPVPVEAPAPAVAAKAPAPAVAPMMSSPVIGRAPVTAPRAGQFRSAA